MTVQDISRAIADVTGASGYTEDEKTQIEKTLCDLFRQFVNLRV